jgi:viroplasmin and RNaseH domain-containing protein
MALKSYKMTHPYFNTINCYYNDSEKNKIYYDLNDIIRVLKITSFEFIEHLNEKEFLSILKGKKHPEKLIAITYEKIRELMFLSNNKEYINEFFNWLRFMKDQ